MPRYDYRCKDCSYEFEAIQSLDEDKLIECPKCQGMLIRLFGVIPIRGTSATTNRIRSDKNSQSQLSEARKYELEEMGVRSAVAMKGQTEDQAHDQLKRAGSFIKDEMQKSKERKRNDREKQQKAWRERSVKQSQKNNPKNATKINR